MSNIDFAFKNWVADCIAEGSIDLSENQSDDDLVEIFDDFCHGFDRDEIIDFVSENIKYYKKRILR